MNDCATANRLHPDLIRQLRSWYETRFSQKPTSIQVEEMDERRFSRVCRVNFGGAAEPKTFVLKQNVDHEENRVYRERGSAANFEFEALQSVAPHMTSTDCFRVPLAHCVVPQHDAILMSQEPGASLETLLPAARVTARKATMQIAIDAFHGAGMWLSKFQQLELGTSDSSACLTSTLNHCDDRLQQIEKISHPSVPDELRSDCLKKLTAWISEVDGPVPLAACHGDFGPWNQMFDGTRLTVLDFFSYRIDCRLIDPISMLTYLESQRHAPSFSARRIERLQQAFLAGYDLDFEVPPQVIQICEAEQRLRRLHDCLMERGRHWGNRFRLAKTIHEQVEWLLGDSTTRYMNTKTDSFDLKRRKQ